MSDNDSIKPSGESEDEKEIKDIVKELENAVRKQAIKYPMF